MRSYQNARRAGLSLLNLAAYYYEFRLLLVLLHSPHPGRPALIFAVEVVSYSAKLFEDHDATLRVYRSILVALLLLAFYAKPLQKRNFAPLARTSGI